MPDLVALVDGTPLAVLLAMVITPLGWPVLFIGGWLMVDLVSFEKPKSGKDGEV